MNIERSSPVVDGIEKMATLTLTQPVAPTEAVDPGLRGLLRRSYGVLRGLAEADPEEPLGALQRGVVERLVKDLALELGVGRPGVSEG